MFVARSRRRSRRTRASAGRTGPRPAAPSRAARAASRPRCGGAASGSRRIARQRDREQDQRVDPAACRRPAGRVDHRREQRPDRLPERLGDEVASSPTSPRIDSSGVISAITSPATSTTPAAAGGGDRAATIPGSASRSRSRPESSPACGSTRPMRSWNGSRAAAGLGSATGSASSRGDRSGRESSSSAGAAGRAGVAEAGGDSSRGGWRWRAETRGAVAWRWRAETRYGTAAQARGAVGLRWRAETRRGTAAQARGAVGLRWQAGVRLGLRRTRGRCCGPGAPARRAPPGPVRPRVAATRPVLLRSRSAPPFRAVRARSGAQRGTLPDSLHRTGKSAPGADALAAVGAEEGVVHVVGGLPPDGANGYHLRPMDARAWMVRLALGVGLAGVVAPRWRGRRRRRRLRPRTRRAARRRSCSPSTPRARCSPGDGNGTRKDRRRAGCGGRAAVLTAGFDPRSGCGSTGARCQAAADRRGVQGLARSCCRSARSIAARAEERIRSFLGARGRTPIAYALGAGRDRPRHQRQSHDRARLRRQGHLPAALAVQLSPSGIAKGGVEDAHPGDRAQCRRGGRARSWQCIGVRGRRRVPRRDRCRRPARGEPGPLHTLTAGVHPRAGRRSRAARTPGTPRSSPRASYNGQAAARQRALVRGGPQARRDAEGQPVADPARAARRRRSTAGQTCRWTS